MAAYHRTCSLPDLLSTQQLTHSTPSSIQRCCPARSSLLCRDSKPDDAVPDATISPASPQFPDQAAAQSVFKFRRRLFLCSELQNQLPASSSLSPDAVARCHLLCDHRSKLLPPPLVASIHDHGDHRLHLWHPSALTGDLCCCAVPRSPPASMVLSLSRFLCAVTNRKELKR